MFSPSQSFETNAPSQKRDRQKNLFSLLAATFAQPRDGHDGRTYGELIARHLAGFRASSHAADDPTARQVITRNDVLSLADAGLRDDADGARAVVDDVLKRGARWLDVALALFEPAFRELGDYWRRDERNFVEVGLAGTTLQTVYRQASIDEDLRNPPAQSERCCLMLRLNRNRHTSGALIIADLMHKSGWDVTEMDRSDGSIAEAVGGAWYDLVCISLSQKEDLTFLEKAIVEVRRMSRNPGIAVLVGGPAFVNHPDLRSSTAADAVALDGRDALGRADALWAERGSRMDSVKRG